MKAIPSSIRKILVPTDFSELAFQAFHVALQLARKSGAQIKLLHVVEMPLTGAGYGAFYAGIEMNPVTSYQTYDLLLPELLEQSRQQMEKLAQTGLENGIIIEQEVVADMALSKIVKVAEEEGIDLVVIGSAGAGGLEEFLIGSDAEEVVRHCPCPVLTIKQKHEPFQINYLLFPSDFAPEVNALVPYLKFFQQFFEAHLNLLYVRTKSHHATDTEIHERMHTFVDQNQLTDVTLIIQPNPSASAGIMEAATTMNHDLILMPTHGRTGWSHLFHKSIAESVVNHASIPVLTFHWPADPK